MAKPRRPKLKPQPPTAGGFGVQAPTEMRLIGDSQKSKDPADTCSEASRGGRWPTWRAVLLVGLALLCGLLHALNGYTLFENDRYFSHLSTLEREMTFRTEMGLYYSYYKTVAEAPTFASGLLELMRNNVTEYPSTINTLRRFNLYPEVVIGLAYRIFNHTVSSLGTGSKICWMIDRKELPSVESCTGLGDVATFYVISVYLWNIIMGMALVGLAALVSDSLLAATLSAVLFFCNYNEATRIQWTPPLRESFAYPLLLAQMFLTTRLLRRRVEMLSCVSYVVLTTCCLLCWQFSQFALLTQICALFLVFSWHNQLHWHQLQYIAAMHLCSLFIAYSLLFMNDMLLTSLYTATVTATVIVCHIPILNIAKWSLLKAVVQTSLLVGMAIGIKFLLAFLLQVADDSHIWGILRAKMSDYKDFHTMLYTCAPEFDFLKFDYVESIWPTLLIPLALVFFFVGSKIVQCQNMAPEVLYNLYQCLAFTAMAVMVMRLKMFLTPHLCVLSSLAISPRFLTKYYWRLALAAVILAIIAVPGWRRFEETHLHQGEYSNPNLEELLTFIDDYAEPTDSFAGPMPLMANILLSTGRPVINHPHYEDAGIRAKTVKIYTLLSRKSLREVYANLKQLLARYIVLSRAWCRGKMRTGCALVDIWDELDPMNRHKPQVCERLARGDTEGFFDIVFQNDEYTMLALM